MKDKSVKSVESVKSKEQVDIKKQKIIKSMIESMDKDGFTFALHSEIFDVIYRQYTKPLNKLNFTIVFIMCIFWIISITVDKAAPLFLSGVFSCLVIMLINQLYLKQAYEKAKEESRRVVKNFTTVIDILLNASNSNENQK